MSAPKVSGWPAAVVLIAFWLGMFGFFTAITVAAILKPECPAVLADVKEEKR